MPRTSKTISGNVLLLAGTCLICLIAVEFVLRWRYPDRTAAVTDEVRQVQAYLKLHPKLGFTWQENIAFNDHIVLKVSDTELDALSTDRWGFINAPEAISEETAGNPVDIAGLGDSFMEHGSFLFHSLFKEAGYSYYSMAIHRQCPPQCNIILKEYALTKKPKWVVYGLFENDFEETEDFEKWARSGMDWFTYHSGTWCGRPQTAGFAERIVHRGMPGYYVAYRRAREKLRLTSAQAARALPTNPAQVGGYIRTAQAAARAGGARFLLVLIPSKETAIAGRSPESNLYDSLLDTLSGDQLDIIDLRKPFREASNPASLYYVVDGHWNRDGIRLAADVILSYIQSHGGKS